MKIDIVSTDQRYRFVCELLCGCGYEARVCAPSEVGYADYLLLSVRRELSDVELKSVLSKISKETVVLCGDDERIDRLFNGKKIVYSSDCDFLQKNANLTAEATVSFLHSLIKDELRDRKIFISGYGRIGSLLSKHLLNLGCSVFVYARREEVRNQVIKDGACPVILNECVGADVIINTVPHPIYTKELIAKIPKDVFIIELASQPYGFEGMERVVLASGLPGKILPVGASRAIYDTVTKILSRAETE
jgi:hypothetical protein